MLLLSLLYGVYSVMDIESKEITRTQYLVCIHNKASSGSGSEVGQDRLESRY